MLGKLIRDDNLLLNVQLAYSAFLIYIVCGNCTVKCISVCSLRPKSKGFRTLILRQRCSFICPIHPFCQHARR